MVRFRLKDIKVLPLITIPILIYYLIFDREEGDLIFSVSIFTIGIILFRILNFKEIGIILSVMGVLLLLLADRDYKESRLYVILSFTNLIFLKHYDKAKLRIRILLKPLFEYKYFSIISETFYWFMVIAWLLILIGVMLLINKDILNFEFSLIVPIAVFVIIYVIGKNE